MPASCRRAPLHLGRADHEPEPGGSATQPRVDRDELTAQDPRERHVVGVVGLPSRARRRRPTNPRGATATLASMTSVTGGRVTTLRRPPSSAPGCRPRGAPTPGAAAASDRASRERCPGRQGRSRVGGPRSVRAGDRPPAHRVGAAPHPARGLVDGQHARDRTPRIGAAAVLRRRRDEPPPPLRPSRAPRGCGAPARARRRPRRRCAGRRRREPRGRRSAPAP
jgi:hypothetical protein